MHPWKVEFHCHTVYSADSMNTIPLLLRTARQRGLTRLIVTDHNNIRGALAAKQADPELVIVGEEILTQKGELLAAFVSEEVPPLLPPMEAIRRLKDQGAFISVSHPFDIRRNGWAPGDLAEIMPHVDAIEVFNARSFSPAYNDLAIQFAQRNDLAGTVGSDAHAWFEIGRAVLALPPFHNAEELRAVIRQGELVGGMSSPLVHLSSSLARIVNYKRRLAR